MIEKNKTKLIKRIKHGDEEGFSILYEEYANKIFYLSIKYTQNRADAEDCVQEIFLRIIKYIDKYDESKANLGTWIYQVSKNYLLNYIKSNDRRRNKINIDNESIDGATYEVDSNLKVTLSDLEKYLGVDNYQILVMKQGYQMTFDDISKELNFSPSKVKRLYYDTLTKAKNFVISRGGKDNE